jgi:serine phosphatase RsbU (regulator of sigma subunit)
VKAAVQGAKSMSKVRELLGRPGCRWAVVVALLAVVFGLRFLVSQPVIGVGFLYLAPVLAAALWFGRAGGVAVAVAAAGMYTLGNVIAGEGHPLAAGLLRLVVYCVVGYVFAELAERDTRLRRRVSTQELELTELRALRAALVPPGIPDRPAVDLATCFVPAQERVAGDFYFIGAGPNDATVVVVGDVVGKGFEAARRAAFVRAALAAYAPHDDDPCRLLELANTALVERAGTSDDFVTAACMVYRPGDRSMSWALAGHPAPILLDEGGGLNTTEPGLPLGLDEKVACDSAERRLAQGDGVLLFTDGLLEARRPNGASGEIADDLSPPELFGKDRIAAVLSEHRGKTPNELVRALRAAAERFTGGGLTDDLCMVAVRVR